MLPPFLRVKAHLMLIFGIREKEHEGEAVINVVCKNCGHVHHGSFGISRYFHIFWIPFMVTSRQVGLRCSNCKRLSMNGEIPHEAEQRAKKNIFTPLRSLPLYSGSFLLILFASLLYVAHLDNMKDERALLQNPRANDVYLADLSLVFPEHNFGEFNLGTMRILSVTDEGILLAISKESFNDSMALTRKIKRATASKDEFYGDRAIFLSNEDVINLYNADAIRSITRDFRPENNSNPIIW